MAAYCSARGHSLHRVESFHQYAASTLKRQARFQGVALGAEGLVFGYDKLTVAFDGFHAHEYYSDLHLAFTIMGLSGGKQLKAEGRFL